MDFSLHYIPAQFQNAAALLSGLLALSGLILWSAGIKVARALSATFAGIFLAVIFGTFLPGPLGLAPIICVIIGLAAGITVGILAFRTLQGVVLAASCAVILSGIFYQSQQPQPMHISIPATAAAQVESAAASGNLVSMRIAESAVRAAAAWWQGVPAAIRQQMLVIGVGIAIAAFAVALAFSKATTWVFTAAMGAAMFLTGALLLVQRYLPALFHQIPASLSTRLAIVGALILIGMILQHTLFWPRKGKQSEGSAAPGHALPA
jgi:hypothetical protein